MDFASPEGGAIIGASIGIGEPDASITVISFPISSSLISIVMLISTITILPIKGVYANEAQATDLIERVSKDFTSKFCNSTGFGLSKESAMAFSVSENNAAFKKKKGFQNIDKELLALIMGIFLKLLLNSIKL